MSSNKRDLVIEGKFVRLEEVQPRHFPYIIEWRNNPENNKFLNQPFKLTMELQTKWYEKKYLKDGTQGLFVMVDKKTDILFGTLGWTDYNEEKKHCILGRGLVGDLRYRGSVELIDGYRLVQDYLYDELKILINYCHVVNENRKVISYNRKWGFIVNNGKIQFPNELFVNGMHQTEYIRSKEQYERARNKIVNLLNL